MKAVAYYRMSSDDQADSIAQQKKEVLAYAKKQGYKIIHEYADEGISGLSGKRDQFQRLLHDASKGEFSVIVCWSSSRFSRQDGIRSARYKEMLMQYGVSLDAVKEGKIDWNTFEGRTIDFINSEGHYRGVKEFILDTVRGKNGAFAKGQLPWGKIPYGYSRRYFFGDKEVIVARNESFRKSRGWGVEVIICEDEAFIIRFIFEQWATRDISLTQLCRLLDAKHILPPQNRSKDGSQKSECWGVNVIRYILRNPAYKGICQVGSGRQQQPSQFASLTAGENDKIFPAIVDAQLWERCQSRFKRTGAPMKNAYSPLQGIVYCGHCGCRMSRQCQHKKYYRYRCTSYSKRPGKGCRGWSVTDDVLIPRLWTALVKHVDLELLKQYQAKPEAEQITDLDLRVKQLADLREQLTKAQDRYLTCPPHLMAGLENRLTLLQEQSEILETEIKIIQTAKNETGLAGLVHWWEGVKDTLIALDTETGEEASGAKEVCEMVVQAFPPKKAKELLARSSKYFLLTEHDRFREFLHRLGVKVTLFFRDKPVSRQSSHRRNRKPPKWTQPQVDWNRSRLDVGFAWDGQNHVCPLGDSASITAQRTNLPYVRFSRCLAS